MYEKSEAYIGKGWFSESKEPVIMLPHSCDEWVIGSPDNARQLIADLEKLILQLEGSEQNE